MPVKYAHGGPVLNPQRVSPYAKRYHAGGSVAHDQIEQLQQRMGRPPVLETGDDVYEWDGEAWRLV